MAALEAAEDAAAGIPPADIKLLMLGDSACGKTKLVERLLLDAFNARVRSTYALTLHRWAAPRSDGAEVRVDIWDSAGQDRFAECHPSYYYKAHVAVLVFDVTRKPTYTHLKAWYDELRQYCDSIPVLVVANKIDADPSVTGKVFAFARDRGLPLHYVSAADGSNVVRLFSDAVDAGLAWKAAGGGADDVIAHALSLLGDGGGSWKGVAAGGAGAVGARAPKSAAATTTAAAAAAAAASRSVR